MNDDRYNDRTYYSNEKNVVSKFCNCIFVVRYDFFCKHVQFFLWTILKNFSIFVILLHFRWKLDDFETNINNWQFRYYDDAMNFDFDNENINYNKNRNRFVQNTIDQQIFYERLFKEVRDVLINQVELFTNNVTFTYDVFVKMKTKFSIKFSKSSSIKKKLWILKKHDKTIRKTIIAIETIEKKIRKHDLINKFFFSTSFVLKSIFKSSSTIIVLNSKNFVSKISFNFFVFIVSSNNSSKRKKSKNKKKRFKIAILIFLYEFFIFFIVEEIYIFFENDQNKKDDWIQKIKVEISSIENSTSTKFYVWYRKRIYSKEEQNEFTKRVNEKNEKQKVTTKAHCQCDVYCRLKFINSTKQNFCLSISWVLYRILKFLWRRRDASTMRSRSSYVFAHVDEVIHQNCERECLLMNLTLRFYLALSRHFENHDFRLLSTKFVFINIVANNSRQRYTIKCLKSFV